MLTYYDQEKSITIQTNAGEYGLGTTLLQDGHPIVFASETLTDTKTRYANIKSDCLSICFGLEKLDTFIYSRHVTIHNNHTPLKVIQHKPLHATPTHLQRMFLECRSMSVPLGINLEKKWFFQTDCPDSLWEEKASPYNYTHPLITFTCATIALTSHKDP